MVLIPVAAIADGPKLSWIDMVETADFVVYAKITKIEQVSDGDRPYITTFSVIQTLKGTPPKEIPVSWGWATGQVSGIDGFLDSYVLFAKKDGDNYSLRPERFMKIVREESSRFVYPKCFGLPPELESKIQTGEIERGGIAYKTRKIKWMDMFTWLNTHFNTGIKSSARPEETR